jgi:hypothetical protein
MFKLKFWDNYSTSNSAVLYERNKCQIRKISHGQTFAYVLFSCIIVIYVLRQYHGSQFLCLAFVIFYIVCFILFFIHSRIMGRSEVNVIRHILTTCLYHHKIYNFTLVITLQRPSLSSGVRDREVILLSLLICANTSGNRIKPIVVIIVVAHTMIKSEEKLFTRELGL